MLNQRTTKNRIAFGVNTRQVWPVYSGLSLNQHGVGEISRSIQVSAKTIEPTMRTRKAARQARTKLATLMAELGSVVRLNPQNLNTAAFSFVLDKGLQLGKTPIVYPIIHPLATIDLSYSFEVFHNNLVSIKTGNNLLAHVVVHPSHVTSFSASNLPQQSFAGTSAFALEFGTQMLEFSFDNLNLRGVEEPAITRDGKVVYSEVDTHARMNVRASSSDLFGKHKQEISPAFIVHSKQAFANPPVRKEVLLVASGNVERKPFSAIQSSDVQHVALKVGASMEIVANTGTPYDRLALCTFDYASSVRDTSNAQLAWQTESAQVSVNDVVQVNIVLDALLPSSVNAILQTSPIRFDSSENASCGWNLDFGSCSNIHTRRQAKQVFKRCAQMSSARENNEGGGDFSSLQQECGISKSQRL